VSGGKLSPEVMMGSSVAVAPGPGHGRLARGPSVGSEEHPLT
jgi:hypothetical protein